MKRFILNFKPTKINLSLCAECHNTGILALGDISVGQERWCEGCADAKAAICDCCGDNVDSDDLKCNAAGDAYCFNCTQTEDSYGA